ncbi:MAG TPA: RIP metalloprotease RseP, partial [candidate division WOR-3 bacterium]|nr:RIP metalloprotease RseP [candidate division WOR-3 bacterium]
MIPSILLVALFISALVTIHEFGHLLVAKLSGIPVEVFSVGFGPTLVKKTWRGTEYRLSLVPLGGYIKMTGENEPAAGPATDQPATPPGTGFNDKPLPVKAAVIAAGPVSNLLLGFVLLSVMFGIFGMRYIAPVVEPAPDSPAAEAGLRSGDLILAAGGDTVPDFATFEDRLARAAGGRLDLAVRRDGARIELSVPVPPDTWYTRTRIRPVVGHVQPGSPADSAGLQVDDSIISANGKALESWHDLVQATRTSPGRPIELTILREDSPLVLSAVPKAVRDDRTGEKVGQLGVSARTTTHDIEARVPPVVGQARSGG